MIYLCNCRNITSRLYYILQRKTSLKKLCLKFFGKVYGLLKEIKSPYILKKNKLPRREAFDSNFHA